MDDTRARFLTAIAAQLGDERIVELHLFSPIRQGVMETGVAVVAVTPAVAPAPAPVPELVPEPSSVTDEAPMGEGAPTDEAPVDEAPVDEAPVDEAPVDEAPVDEAPVDEAPVDEAPVDEAPAEEALAQDADSAIEPSATPIAVEYAVASTAPESARLEVYTARYRLTRKGPDRGKWFFEVAATADAPLATVDVVARGVTLRSKDVTETERLSGEQLRSILREPSWRTPT
jgi:hypothetical protein